MSLASVTIQNNKYSEIYQTYREYIKNPLFYPGVVNLTATMNMVIACAVKTPLHCSFPRKKSINLDTSNYCFPLVCSYSISGWLVHVQGTQRFNTIIFFCYILLKWKCSHICHNTSNKFIKKIIFESQIQFYGVHLILNLYHQHISTFKCSSQNVRYKLL